MILRRSLGVNLCKQNKSHYRSKYEWVAPVGHDTGIQVYNEITKKKVPLIFPNPKYVKWYMCGPTVYDTSHIGHASCYIKSDLIRRALIEYYNIDAVVGIGVTNVSEKILERSSKLHQSPRLLAQQYEMEFFTQMKELNILPPSLILRVSDHIPQISNFILKLLERGAAYKTIDGSVYFKTIVHPNYGRFKKPVAETNQEVIPGKLSPLDFAVWKSKSAKLGKYQSPRGLPGWHIQCSAMASHVFGESLDIHSGGMDLIFPHHENEESQSTAYHNCEQWVNYWFHLGLLNMGEEKMSKSLNNYISISEFLKKNSSDHLRMFCMMSPYRKSSNYDQLAFDLAVNICERVIRFLSISDSYVKGTWILGNIREAELLEEMAKLHDMIKTNLSDDFGVHDALKCVLLLIKKATKMLNEGADKTTGRSPAVIASLNHQVNKFFKSFGFAFAESGAKNEVQSALGAVIDTTVNFRRKMRERALSLEDKSKNQIFALCDESRDNLQSIGVILNDLSPSHTYWSLTDSKLNNGSTLKSVIDILVWFRAEILKLIPTLPSVVTQHEFADLCRSTKMDLSMFGVFIDDLKSGRSSWSFPKSDSAATSKFEVIISSTLKFYADIRKIAMSLRDGDSTVQAKADILALCDTAISNLESFGVIVKDEDAPNANWILEVNNIKGKSIVQNVMEMIMGSRDQVKSLALLAKDATTESKLDNICYKTKKFLKNYGFIITDPYDRNSQTTWNINESVANKNKILVNNLIDVLVMFIYEIKVAAESLVDISMKNLLLEICNSLENDLLDIGVKLVTKGEGVTWAFKDFESVSETKGQQRKLET